jgi:hypothetical protein
MPGSYPFALPAASGVISGTLVEPKYKKSVFNVETKKYEEIEVASSIESQVGGVIQGWSLYAPEKSKFIIYDNIEKAEGANYGEVALNEKESIRDWFGPNGLKFKHALYFKVLEGKVEGCLFIDIE